MRYLVQVVPVMKREVACNNWELAKSPIGGQPSRSPCSVTLGANLKAGESISDVLLYFLSPRAMENDPARQEIRGDITCERSEGLAVA